jgi:hypothetical protein
MMTYSDASNGKLTVVSPCNIVNTCAGFRLPDIGLSLNGIVPVAR